ncbi:MAG: hypothetical protein GXY88_05805 [Tissierellia bacterium]|nr:hypothetical protein [Tissierellia bacterium]
MTRERIKTFLLLSLVYISLFLTRKLWIEMPYQIMPLFQKEEISSTNYLFADMIKPNKYLLNFDNKNHTIFFNDHNNNLWTSTRSFLADVLSSDNIKTEFLTDEEFSAYNNMKSIVFYFPEKFNSYLLARSLNIAKPNSIPERIPTIESIYCYLGRGEPYVVFSEGKRHLKVYNLNIDMKDIKDIVNDIERRGDYTNYYSMKEALGIDNDIYIPINMSKTMPLIYVENELDVDDIDGIREIAEAFFDKDIEYLREIIEGNGSILYIYDQRVLKIYQNGLLEYFHPLEAPVRERNLYISLNTAAEFLSQHIGVPKDLYISKIEEIEAEEDLGYRLTFKYRIGGMPVILGNPNIEDFIQIDVFNNYVRNYKRFMRKAMYLTPFNRMDNSSILSAFDIINMDMNYELLEKVYIEDNGLSIEGINREELKDQVLSSIDNIALAYLDPCTKKKEEKLIGVWLIQVGDGIYAFDVYRGNLIFVRNS